jgi:hypothetical protein
VCRPVRRFQSVSYLAITLQGLAIRGLTMHPSEMSDDQLQDILFEATMDKNFDLRSYLVLIAEMAKRMFLAQA